MKIATFLGKHGLTLAQYRALSAAKRCAFHRVGARIYRFRGGLEPVPAAMVSRLSDRGLLEIAGPAATITDAGRQLLRDLEGFQ